MLSNSLQGIENNYRTDGNAVAHDGFKQAITYNQGRNLKKDQSKGYYLRG